MRNHYNLKGLTFFGLMSLATTFCDAQTEPLEKTDEITVVATPPTRAAEEQAARASKGLDSLGVVLFLGTQDKHLKRLATVEEAAERYQETLSEDYRVQFSVVAVATDEKKSSMKMFINEKMSLEGPFDNGTISKGTAEYIKQQDSLGIANQPADILEVADKIDGYVIIRHLGSTETGRYNKGSRKMEHDFEVNVKRFDGADVEVITDYSNLSDPASFTAYSLIENGEFAFDDKGEQIKNLRAGDFDRALYRFFRNNFKNDNANNQPEYNFGN